MIGPHINKNGHQGFGPVKTHIDLHINRTKFDLVHLDVAYVNLQAFAFKFSGKCNHGCDRSFHLPAPCTERDLSPGLC